MELTQFEPPVSTPTMTTPMRANLQQMNNVSMDEYNQFLQNGTTQPSSAPYQSNTQFSLPPTTNPTLTPINSMPTGNNQMPPNPVNYGNSVGCGHFRIRLFRHDKYAKYGRKCGKFASRLSTTKLIATLVAERFNDVSTFLRLVSGHVPSNGRVDPR